ncbi:hypothetical protein [Archangium sp.]|uniref:hypothetical protein n=1 Tax=Archangium sp. TaxID=1872627 RepID=UPI00389ABBC2
MQRHSRNGRHGAALWALALGILLAACGSTLEEEPTAEVAAKSSLEAGWKAPCPPPLGTAVDGPSVAFDGRNHLVVWRDTRSGGIFGARVKPDGTVLEPGGFLIHESDKGKSGTPKVAFNGTHYVVVWDGIEEIAGIRVARDGTVLPPKFFITGGDEFNGPLGLACAPGLCMVAYRGFGSAGTDITLKRIASDGTVLEPALLVSGREVDFVTDPAVAWDGKQFLVVWTDGRNGSETPDIFGDRVLPDGTVLDPGGFPIAVEPGEQRHPDVVWSGRRFVVVWDDTRNGTHDIFGARVNPKGRVEEPDGIPISVGPGEQTFPQVAHHEGKSLVVWGDTRSGASRIWGARVKEDGSVVESSGVRLSRGDFAEEFLPSVAVGSGRYLIPYAGGSTADPETPHDILAVRMKTDGTVLDSPEILLTADLGGDLLVSNGIDASVHRYDGTTGAFEEIFVAPHSGGLDNPQALVFGPDGNLYIASFGSRNVLRYDGRTGAFLDVFVPPGSGGLGAPGELAFGPDDNLYVSDSFFGTNSVLRYDGKTGAFLGVFASGGGLSVPQRLAFGSGFLFVQSVLSRDVLRYDGKTGAPRPAPGQSGAIFIPGVDAIALTIGRDGRLYVTTRADEVRRYNARTGAFLGVFVPAGSGGLSDGNDMEFGPDGNLYIPDFLPSSVLRYDGRTGAFLGPFVPPGSGGLSFPVTLTFMPTFDPRSCRATGHDLGEP